MRPAPSPDDVLWNNLRLRRWEVAVRRQLLTGVLVVLVLFYAIPVGAVQAILQVGCVRWQPCTGPSKACCGIWHERQHLM